MTTANASPTRRRRLSKRARKATLVVHIVAAGTWIGIDVVLAVVVFTGLTTHDPETAALCFRALELFATWPLLLAGTACLISGIVLGVGTTYGLVRYWWVAAKLAVNVVFVALVPLSLRPTVSSAAEYGRDLTGSGAAPPSDPGLLPDLAFPPVVSLIGLLVAVLLSVFRPWGRIRTTRTRLP